jgi:carboxymethylenebutenolidase
MCDKDLYDQDLQHHQHQARLSRRAMGLLAGAALVATPGLAQAGPEVTEAEVQIVGPDGAIDAFFVHPRDGATPGVLIWPDILGLRPAFRDMARELARTGYAVLVANPYYRVAPAPVVPAGATFADPSIRERVLPLKQGLLLPLILSDARTLIGWLASQAAVDPVRRLAAIGYCMGGPFALRTGALLPERVGAIASFHGGGLLVDGVDSPHLQIPRLRAEALIAIAENDDQREPGVKDSLRSAFSAAGMPAEIEVYPAAHGWCPPDSAVHNAEQARRAGERLRWLLGHAL